MKTLALTVLVVFTLSAKASPVIDFSEDHSWQFPDKLYDFQEKQILAQIFTKYVRTEDACGDAKDVEAVTGDVKIVRGAFSAPNQDELVVVFASSPCPVAHSSIHGNLALFRNMTLVDARNDLPSFQIEKSWDVDGDGANELLVSATDGNQGYFQTLAETVTFRGGHIRKTGYISGIVHSEDCGANAKLSEGKIIDSVFFADNKKNLKKVVQKNFQKSCEEGAKYKPNSTGPIPNP